MKWFTAWRSKRRTVEAMADAAENAVAKANEDLRKALANDRAKMGRNFKQILEIGEAGNGDT